MSGIDEIQTIIESARRLGVELDETETTQWLTALAAQDGDEIVVSADGAFGHRITMLDYSPAQLDRFRRIGAIVELTGPEGVVEGALALSGSAAQSKIQSYPGDADFFQRVNIIAPTRAEATEVLARILREKVDAFERGTTYQFLEAKLGTLQSGSPISWKLADIQAGEIATDDGVITWGSAAADPGWVKLDWVVTDPDRGRLSNASNVIDVTWEGPDGEIVPLDGYLDAYFQEVYLDADEVPVFAKVAKFVSDDALDDYVAALEKEVRKYLTHHLNYGKAAKRMYNIFRYSGRHLEAAFVRELFDEPTTILYQVWSLIGALDNATQPNAAIPVAAVQDQADNLILDVARALDGDEEAEIIAALQRLRRTLEGQQSGEERTAEVAGAQALVVNLVNTFFHDRLCSVPTIKDYIEAIQADEPAQ
jgi:hypothetical protein